METDLISDPSLTTARRYLSPTRPRLDPTVGTPWTLPSSCLPGQTEVDGLEVGFELEHPNLDLRGVSLRNTPGPQCVLLVQTRDVTPWGPMVLCRCSELLLRFQEDFG